MADLELDTMAQRAMALERAGLGRLRASEARVAKAGTRAEALERRMAELQQLNRQELAAESLAFQRQVAKVNQGVEKELKASAEQAQAVIDKRAAAEAETRRVLEEVDAMKRQETATQEELVQQVASMDLRTAEALQTSAEQVRVLQRDVETKVREVIGGLQAESARAWALEDTKGWSETISGARSMRRDAQMRATQRPKPLPFDMEESASPFKGFGNYGKCPPLQRPNGFQAETARALWAVT